MGFNRRPRRDGGFSLIEILVVVAIMGMIAVIMTIAVSRTLKRQRLETAAHEVQSFVERAYVLTASQGTGVFLQLSDPPAADGSRTLTLYADTNGDQMFDKATDQVLETQVIPGDILVQTATTTWPHPNNPAGLTYYLLYCDWQGRSNSASETYTGAAPIPSAWLPVPLTGPPLTAPVALSLTHKEMAAGVLKPNLRYDILVNVLWRPTIVKYMNGAKVS